MSFPRRFRRRFPMAAFLCLGLAAPVAGHTPSIEPPPGRPLDGGGAALIRSFDQQERGGGDQCFSIAQDAAGRILVATPQGLGEYDGERWREHELPASMLAVAVGDRGRIWVGGGGQLGEMVREDTGELRFRSLLDRVRPEQRGFSEVWPVFATGGDVFFVAREYLFRLRDGEIRSWIGDTRKVFYRAYRIHGRSFFARLGVGLVELAEDDRLVPVAEGLFGGDTEINAFFELPSGDSTRPGSLLFTRRRGVWHFDGERFERHPSPMSD